MNQATHTIYVGNGGENTVSVINGAPCNATRTSGCGRSVATVTVGNNPLGVAVDQATNTIYVANSGENTVSVINGAICNGTNTSGCGQHPPTVTVGGGASLLAVDPATDTIYVASFDDNTVSVINGATCNGIHTSGCGQVPHTVSVGAFPDGVAVDETTHTVYVANGGDTTVSVIDGSTCNSTDSSGCGQTPATVDVGGSPVELAVDQATSTVYVPVGLGDVLGFVAMIDTAICSGSDSSGCDQPSPTVQVGTQPDHVAVDPGTHTVYVSNQGDSTVSVIDDATCNATDSSGCSTPLPAMATRFDPGSVEVDSATHTLYASSQDYNSVSVLNGATCSATRTSGCTRFAPTTPVGILPQGVAANPDTHTVYVANRGDGTLSVIKAATCNASHVPGCGQTWATVALGDSPQGVAVDRATDTIYTANGFNGENTVSVIDGRSCNGGQTSGCGQTPAKATAGNGAFAVAVNQATKTIYVANRNDNTVSVIDGRTCNGSHTAGCSQNWPAVAVGDSPQSLAVNRVTNTIYVTNTGDDTVSVINGATCNAADTFGCGQIPPAVAVGAGPRAVGVNQATDTIYVGNRFDGTVSVIDGRRCNGTSSSGCGQTPATVAIGSSSANGLAVGRSITIDQATDTAYVTSVVDSDVVSINGAACRAGQTKGCRATALKMRTGGWPINLALDQVTGTLYVADNVDANVSFFHSRR